MNSWIGREFIGKTANWRSDFPRLTDASKLSSGSLEGRSTKVLWRFVRKPSLLPVSQFGMANYRYESWISGSILDFSTEELPSNTSRWDSRAMRGSGLLRAPRLIRKLELLMKLLDIWRVKLKWWIFQFARLLYSFNRCAIWKSIKRIRIRKKSKLKFKKRYDV